MLTAVVLSWFLANHWKTIELRRSGNVLDADAIALGAWLRQEITRPQTIDLSAGNGPVRLWLRQPSFYPMLAVVYASGYPGRVQEWKNASDPEVASMRPGQYLVSDRDVEDAALTLEARHGRYAVYRLRAGAPSASSR